MKCENCEREIPAERLRVLPDTKTCVRCSTTKRVVEPTRLNYPFNKMPGPGGRTRRRREG